MATQQQPDGGRSYSVVPGRFDARPPRVAPGLEPVPADPDLEGDQRDYRVKPGPIPATKYRPRKGVIRIIPRPHRNKKPRKTSPDTVAPASAITATGGAYLKDGTMRNKSGNTGGGSKKGVRGPRPALITEPVTLLNFTDAGAMLRRQRRALGRTADEASLVVDEWASTLIKYEGGKDMRMSKFLKIADRLGLRVMVAAKP